MKSLLRLLCLTFLLVLCAPAFADVPYRPSDIQAALSQHDYATADREIQAVLVAAPNSAVAHYWAAKVLAEEHHAGQALVEVQKAQALPPPHFKDPAKLAAFNAGLAKAAVDLQRTLTDEETALAHPRTTTTTEKVLPHRTVTVTAVPTSTLVYHHHQRWQLLAILGGMVLLAILCVILVRLLLSPKPETVRVVHVTDRMASRPNRAPVSNYAVPPSYSDPNPGVSPHRSTAFAMAPASAGVTAGHSTGAMVGAGLGGLAAGMLLDEALHNHGGFGGGVGANFLDRGTAEEVDTTTTTTGYDDAAVQQDYQQVDQDLGSNSTDNDFGSSDDSGSADDDSGTSDSGWGGDD